MSKPTPQCTHDRLFVCSLCSGGEIPASSTAGLESKSASPSCPSCGSLSKELCSFTFGGHAHKGLTSECCKDKWHELKDSDGANKREKISTERSSALDSSDSQSASPSEPRPDDPQPIGTPEEIAADALGTYESWRAEPRRDEALHQQAEEFLLTNYANIRGRWQFLKPILADFAETILAARASAAPLNQTDESLKVSLRELLDAANLVSYAECPSDADSDRYEAARVNAAKALADPPSLPQENADSLKPNFVAGEGLKTTPSAGQTEGK